MSEWAVPIGRREVAQITLAVHGSGMPFIIIDTEGKPLRNPDGELIVVPTRKEAARFLKPGEQVAAVPIRGLPQVWTGPRS